MTGDTADSPSTASATTRRDSYSAVAMACGVLRPPLFVRRLAYSGAGHGRSHAWSLQRQYRPTDGRIESGPAIPSCQHAHLWVARRGRGELSLGSSSRRERASPGCARGSPLIPVSGSSGEPRALSGACRCSAARDARPRSCSTVRPTSRAICRNSVGEMSRPA